MSALKSQLDSQTNQVNAELPTRTALANAQSALTGSMWAGGQAQTAFMNQMQQERADTMAKYGVDRDKLATDISVIDSLAQQTGAMGAAQEGWNYQQQQIAQQEKASDQAFWGGLLNTGAQVLGTGAKLDWW